MVEMKFQRKGLIKKVLLGVALLVLIFGVLYASSPSVRSKSNEVAAKTARTLTSTVQRTGRIASPTRSPRKLTVSAASCTYKEFSDIASSKDPVYGWAYWYLHSAKQNGILTYSDSACTNGTIAAGVSSQVMVGDLCSEVKRATGSSISCPSGDGDDYMFWNRYMNISQIKTEIARQSVTTNNPVFPAGSTAPNWSETGCVCETPWHDVLGNPQTWDCDSCEQNSDAGGTCMVSSLHTYTPTCGNHAQAVALTTYNTNKALSYKVAGTISVANNSRPVSELAGTKIEIFETQASGTIITPAIGTATVSFDGTNQKYEIVFNKNIKDFISSVPDKTYEAYVTPGSDQFYPDARLFKFTNILTNLNFSLLWKEDFTAQSFSDVGSDHWAYWYVTSAAQNHIMGGFSGSFLPDMQVTRAQAAIYSTLSKGDKPCCGIVGDPGTAGSCQTCVGYQTYYDLTPDNYFWPYAQSALLAGTMTGYLDDDTGIRTFRPLENIPQQQVWWTMQKGGIPGPDFPPEYQPLFNDPVPASRAQVAALYTWNFNRNVSVTVSGQVSIKDNAKPLTDLVGSNVVLIDTGNSVPIGSATLSQISTDGRFTVNYQWPIQDLYDKVVAKTLKLEIHSAGFKNISNPEFDIFEIATQAPAIMVQVDAGDVLISGTLNWLDGCTQPTEPLKTTSVSIGNSNQVNAAVKFENGIVSYSGIYHRTSAVAESIALAASGPNISMQLDFININPGDISVIHNFKITSLNTKIIGRFTDSQTGQGISDMDYVVLAPNAEGESDAQGYFSFDLENLRHTPPWEAEFYRIGEKNQKGYPWETSPVRKFMVNGCPTQQIPPIVMDKSPTCQDIDGVEFCWYGSVAKQWQQDSLKASVWREMSAALIDVKTKTGTQLPLRVNVMSNSESASAISSADGTVSLDEVGALPLYGSIVAGIDFLDNYPLVPLNQCVKNYLYHEFGHIYLRADIFDEQNNFWIQKYTIGNQFDHVGIFQSASDTSPWRKVTDSTYSGCARHGHPWDDEDELFASTFSISRFAQDGFKMTTQNAAHPDTQGRDIKTWMSDMYNKHANTWAGNPFNFF